MSCSSLWEPIKGLDLNRNLWVDFFCEHEVLSGRCKYPFWRIVKEIIESNILSIEEYAIPVLHDCAYEISLGMTRNLTSFMLISARLLESIRLTFGRSARKGQFQRMFRLRVAVVHKATKQLAPWPFGPHPHALWRSWSARSAYSDFRVTT